MKSLWDWLVGFQARIGRQYSRIIHNRMAIGFPWYWPAGRNETPAMRTIRRAARRLIAHDRPWLLRCAIQIAVALTWPIGAAVHLRLVLRNTAAFDAADLRRHALDAYWVALRHNVWPVEYFSFELWKPESRADVDNYFYDHEIPRVLAASRGLAGESDPIGDKIEFERFCTMHGLPCLQTLMVVRAEAPQPEVDRVGEGELWIKPTSSYGGQGGEPFACEGSQFVDAQGNRLDRRQFLDRLLKRAVSFGPMLVQPRARNHPALMGLTNGHAAVFRLITCFDAGRGAFLVGAYVELPTGMSGTSQGAQLAAIDAERGRFKQARKHNVRLASLTADQVDLEIPFWDAARSAVLRGHAQLSLESLLGWDVVITAQGPVLLESNRNISTNEIQFAEGRPTFSRQEAALSLARRLTTVKVMRMREAPRPTT